MIKRLRLYDLYIYLRSKWYFEVLGRKRDMNKADDCKSFEESEVNITAYKIKSADGGYEIDIDQYKAALMKKGKHLGHRRDCCGDGHYKCYECMNLDYENSDLIGHYNLKGNL